ncbi:hypothetical protein SLE2022_215620 [Rubroshorea leprosula]
MAMNPLKGKLFFFFYFLFVFASPPVSTVFVISTSLEIQPEPEIKSAPDFNQQEVLLHKLEDLVRNLSEIVANLESKLSESPKAAVPVDEKQSVKSSRFSPLEEDKFRHAVVRDGEKGGAVSVLKYNAFWSERFQFVSAVKLDSDATSINVLPLRDYEGVSKYFAVGDDRGRVYVFLRNGDVVVEFFTQCQFPITAMVSYLSLYRNESVLVTGHQNGVVLVHRIYEGLNGEESSSPVMETIGKFSPSSESGEDGMPVTILEVHHLGRERHILSTDLAGKIRVFTENGKLYGSAMPTSRPLVFLKQRLLFLTETGAGSLDLRTMKIRESECEGLNRSLAQIYVFDATERSKAYGFTSEGDLIHVLLLGDVMNFKCRVRSKKKFDSDKVVALQAIKGYLFLVDQEKVFVYNVSTQHYVRNAGPRFVFSAGVDEIRSLFLVMDMNEKIGKAKPLITSDREKLVLLGLGDGYVGMYRSNLPVITKGESNTILWTSPVLFFLLFLFIAWQFFAKKKETLTSWGLDDPFGSTSATAGAQLGSSSGDRSFVDSSSRGAGADMDLKSSGLRPTSRRYGSPPRYPGGATSSFRSGSADPGSRPASVDPNYRSGSELKYRGPSLDSTAYTKRREALFANNQGVDDSS